MAYKFQLGPTTLSGSLTIAGALQTSLSASGVTTNISASGLLDGRNLSTALCDNLVSATNGGLARSGNSLKINLNDLADATVDIAADGIAIVDGGDGSSKKMSAAGLATAMAGDGLAADTGVLNIGAGSLIDVAADAVAVDLTEAAVASLADGDNLIFLDGGASGAASKCDTSDFADLLGGAGLAVSDSTLAVANATNGGLTVSANAVGLDMQDLSAVTAVVSGDTFGIVQQAEASDPTKKITGDNLITDLLPLLTEAAMTVADDYVVFLDGGGTGDGKKEQWADVVTAMAGTTSATGIDASSGVLSIDIDDLGAEDIATGDTIMFNDDGDDGLHKITVDNLATKSPALLTEASIAAADYVMFLDGGATSDAKKESLADFATFLAGSDGLKAASSVLALDLNSLTAAAVDVANDSIAIIDANDGNASRKESIDDLMEAVAGTGITNTNGVLSVDTSGGDSMTATAVIDGSTLVAGVNYFTGVIDPSAGKVDVILPNTPTVGDIVYLKAPSNCGIQNRVEVGPTNGSHKIDGHAQVILNDAYSSVAFVYVVANEWSIV